MRGGRLSCDVGRKGVIVLLMRKSVDFLCFMVLVICWCVV